jgi:hypothetical protein
LKWINKSPKYLLGYCFRAPLDTQKSDEIIKFWCQNYKLKGEIEAWKSANNQTRFGNEACAIDCSDVQKIFWYKRKTWIPTYRQWKEVPFKK